MNKKLIFGGFAGILVLTVFFFQTQKETTIGLKVADHAARKIATTIAAVSNDFAQKDYTYKNTTQSLDDHILAIQDEDDIIPLSKQILAWDKQYNRDDSGQLTNNRELLRLYAIAAEYIPYAKGLAYRLRDIANKDMGIYAVSLTTLREMKYNLSEAPSHMIAAFGFLTNPNPNENIDGQVGMFKNINDASDYFLDKIALKLERSIDELDSVIKNGKPNRTVFVTNLALSLGKETANKIKEQPENQKIAFDKIVLASHLYGVKAQAETFLASAYYFGSFNFYGSHKFANQIITQTFKSRSTMTVSDIVGADVLSWNNLPSPKEARDFVLKIRKEKKGSNRKANDNLRGPRAKKASIFTQFLKLKQTKHKLAEAKKFFMLANESDYNYHKALIDLGTLPSQESYIVNANIYSNHSHAPLEVVNIRKKMFNNSQAIEIKNYTTNHKMLININKFFDPEVVEDLFAYAPNKFNPTKEFQGRGKHKKWNYLYGRSERWPDPKFGGLLPNGTKGNVRKDLATIYQHPSLAFLIPVMSLYR